MQYGLEGRTALVTGAARDVGRQIALTLAAEGARVAVNYNKSQAEAEAVVREIEKAGGTAMLVKGDVADHASVLAMVEKIVAAWERIDILVNNAGLVLRKRFLETTAKDWDAQINVGLYGVIHTCHAVLPHMMKNEFGRIINLCGDSARVGESGLAVTASSRAGALALSKSLAKEFGRNNITVNAVAFGLVETAHNDPKWLEANAAKILPMYPLRRIGKPADVAPMVAFLASSGAAWITGQVVSVNGGFSMV